MDELAGVVRKPGPRTILARRKWALEQSAMFYAGDETGQPLLPKLWSLAVFFEEYLETGAEGTSKAFGPKAPTKLKAVKDGRASK